MKTIVRLMLVVVLLVLAVPLFPAGAQDGGEGDEVLAPEMSAVYFQTATAGSFADNGDGTYSVTITGLVGTGMMCPGDIMAQESSYLGLLSSVTGAIPQGNMLELTSPSGNLLYYEVGTPTPY